MNISFIGFGNMAKAIAKGLYNQEQFTLSAAAPSLIVGFTQDNIATHTLNRNAVKEADIVIMAVKPLKMQEALNSIRSSLPKNCLLISVAAGLNLEWFEKQCDSQQAIIRCMPNTPASLGLGATPLIANTQVTVEQKACAEYIFSQIGLTTWVNQEEQIDSFTALSGSGPAYVFLFLQALIQGGQRLGLDEKIAKEFALQTCEGALQLAKTSSLNLTDLRKQVTSVGGTTAAAIAVLDKQLDTLILKAMHAAKDRAIELGQLYNKEI